MGGSVGVSANEALSLNIIGGNLSASGTAAVGAAAAVPVITKETHAYIGDHAKVNGAGASGVTADTGEITVQSQDTRFDPTQPGVIEGDGSTIDLGFDHGFTEDERVLYDSGGTNVTDSIGGLNSVETTPDQVYYIHVVSPTEVQLKLSPGGTTAGGAVSCVSGLVVCSLTPPATHGESHRLVPTDQAGVREDQSPRFNPATDVSGDTITLPYDLGVKTGDKVVYSSGGGDPIGGLTDGGTYYAIVLSSGNPTVLRLAATYCDAVTSVGDPSNCSSPATPNPIPLSGGLATGKSHSIVPDGAAPAGDASQTGPRTIDVGTDTVDGVAVTASNSDDIAGVGVSAGVAGEVAVNISGVVDVVNVNTSAYIGNSAQVNCGLTCASNVASPDPSQSVRVAAANQFHEIDVAATLAIGGTVGVGVGVGVDLVTLNTDAYIDDGAQVNAADDISVSATGSETIVSVVAGASGGEVGVAGTLTVTILNTHTFACVGAWTSDGKGCANLSVGAQLVAGNSVGVSSRDETKLDLITASLAGGYVGVGVAVGVASVSKDTEAFIGPNSRADGLANGSDTQQAYNGNYDPSGDLGFGVESIRGVAVESASSEDIFGLSASVGGGFVGVAGGVGVTLIHVTTKAWVGESAQINQLSGADPGQSVNVSAVDFFKSLTVAGGAAGGFVGVAGGVDIGIADSSVQAFLQTLSTVNAQSNVEVNAVSNKQVQTYALSVGGGFVGVAGSVSVWSVGTQPTTTYNDGAGGPDKGAWSSGSTYNKGDTVTFGGKTYAARNDLTNDTTSPDNDPTNWEGDTNALAPASDGGGSGPDEGTWSSADSYNSGDVVEYNGSKYQARKAVGPSATPPSSDGDNWVGVSTGGSAQQSGDEAASGDQVGGGQGYKTVLTGSTATNTASAWVTGTAYLNGAEVTFGGHTYRAKQDIVNTTIDPTDDFAEWSQIDGQIMVNSRIATATGGSTSAIATAAPGAHVATGALSTVPSAGTTATIDGTVVAGGHVHVWAKDNLDVNGLAGALAGGFVGVAGSVLILNVDSQTDAGIGGGASITAGSGPGGQISVDAEMNQEKSTAIGVFGAGGFVGVGAQVAVLNDTGTQNAHIDDGAQLLQAGGGVDVTSTAVRDVNADSIGISTGAFGTGAAVGITNVSGDDTAHVGDVSLGAGIAHLNVTTTDNITAGTLAIGVSGGIGAGISGAVAFVDLSGKASATSDATGTVGPGGVSVTAGATHNVSADTVNVATGAFAAGLTIANSTNARSTEAEVTGGSISTSGAATISATSSNHSTANAPGGEAGGVTIDVLVAIAKVTGHTTAELDGSVTGASSIAVQAIGDNESTAKVIVFSVSVVGLTGAYADAEITNDAAISATVGAGASLSSNGAITIDAHGAPGNGTADASAISGTGGGLGAFSVMIADASTNAGLTAELDGSVTHATSLSITATGTNTVTALTIAAGLAGIASANGAVSLAEIDKFAVVAAKAGSTATISGSFATSLTATGTNIATASSDAGSASAGLSIGITIPTARIDGGTTAELDGSITGGTGLTLLATGTNTATAHALAISAGFFAGTGSSSDAEITALASVQALVGKTASVAVGSSPVSVTATAHQNATADTAGGAGGAISISVMEPTALVGGGITAEFDGTLVSADHLTVTAIGSNKADAHTTVVSVGIAAGGAGAVADAEILSSAVTHALVGPDASVSVTHGITVDAHLIDDNNLATALADGGGGGTLVGAVIFKADAEDSGETVAEVAGSITGGDSLTVTATGTNTATATTNAVGIGGLVAITLASSVAHIGTAALVKAFVGSGATIGGSGATLVTATGTNTATATSNAGGGGFGLSVSATLPLAEIEGATTAEFDGTINPGGTGLTVTADGTNTATAHALAVSVGFFAGTGSSSTAVITGNASVLALVGKTAHVNVPGQTVSVTATAHQNAVADTAGGAGGVISVAVMIPTALVGGGSTANFDGKLVSADHLNVTATASNKADAHTFVASVSVLAGIGGATADAEILSSAVTNALVGSDASVSVTNGVTVDAHLFGDDNLATATADGGAGGGLVGAAVFKADAEDNGETVAEVDGAVTGASFLTVTATGTNTATATTNAVGIGGLVAITLASSVAHIGQQALVKAFVGSGAVIGGSGLTQVLATGTNVATATSNAGGGGFGLSVSATLPLAEIEGATTAEFDGTINPGGTGLTVTADGTNTATAHALAVSVGFFAGTGSSSTAVITGNASVLALVGKTAHVNVPGQTVSVTATAHQNAVADTAGGAGGVISVAVMIPTALVGGGSTANFDGKLVSADHLNVTATASNKADAHTFAWLRSRSSPGSAARPRTRRS